LDSAWFVLRGDLAELRGPGGWAATFVRAAQTRVSAAGETLSVDEDVQIIAKEFPESSSGGEPPFCAVPGGVVDRVVVPAGPHDPQPGPSEDADGVGMVLAAAAGVGVDLGRPG